MYSMVLLAAMTTTTETPDSWFRHGHCHAWSSCYGCNGCYGCYGYGCNGCYGGYSCCGCYGSWYGSGCWGGCWGYHGCYGGYNCCGCYGGYGYSSFGADYYYPGSPYFPPRPGPE